MKHRYLVPGLLTGGELIAQLARDLPESLYDLDLGKDRFSPREIIAHLADWEPILRARVELAINSPGATIQAHDEGQRAIDQNYAGQDFIECVVRFQQERARTAALAQTTPEDRLAQVVHHPESGPMSGFDLLAFIPGHDLYHIQQLYSLLTPGSES